jgi:hypothetical protein
VACRCFVIDVIAAEMASLTERNSSAPYSSDCPVQDLCRQP